MNKILKLVVLGIGLLVIACGTANGVAGPLSRSAPEAAGYCPPTMIVERTPFHDIALTRDWIQLSEKDLSALKINQTIDDYSISDDELERLHKLDELTIGWYGRNHATQKATLIVATPSEPYPFFVGMCAIEVSNYLADVLKSIDVRSYEESLHAMGHMDESSLIINEFQRIQDDHSAINEEQNRSWEEIEPEDRSINPQYAPIEVLDKISGHPARFLIPSKDAFISEFILCQDLVEVGKGDCYPIKMSEADHDHEGYSSLELSIQVFEGGSTEVWLAMEVPNKPIEYLNLLHTFHYTQLSMNSPHFVSELVLLPRNSIFELDESSSIFNG